MAGVVWHGSRSSFLRCSRAQSDARTAAVFVNEFDAGQGRRSRSAADITKSALAGEALGTFCAFLGSFAGNVALTFGARGGVYIAGDISPRIVDFLSRSEFRSRFEAKGRLRSYLEAVPSSVIVHPAAAFLGPKSLLDL